MSGGIGELASAMMAAAQRRVEMVAVNISNAGTPGYRSVKVFQRTLDARQALPATFEVTSLPVQEASLKATGNPFDIAVSGPGYIMLRLGDQMYPEKSAQLRRDGDGRLIDGSGRILQSVDSGDLHVSGGTPQLLNDGTLMIGGQAETRIGLFVPQAGERASVVPASEFDPADLNSSQGSETAFHQGMVVASNVDLGAEMVELNRSMRIAEGGAKIFQIYDDLLGRAVTKLGDIGR